MAKVIKELYEGKISENRAKAVIYGLNSLLAAMNESKAPQAAVQINIVDAPGSGRQVEIKEIEQPKAPEAINDGDI